MVVALFRALFWESNLIIKIRWLYKDSYLIFIQTETEMLKMLNSLKDQKEIAVALQLVKSTLAPGDSLEHSYLIPS